MKSLNNVSANSLEALCFSIVVANIIGGTLYDVRLTNQHNVVMDGLTKNQISKSTTVHKTINKQEGSKKGTLMKQEGNQKETRRTQEGNKKETRRKQEGTIKEARRKQEGNKKEACLLAEKLYR